MTSERVIDWVGLIAIIASLPPLWLARRFWDATEPARLLMSRILLGDGAGFLFGGLVLIVTAQWAWTVAIVVMCFLTGTAFGVIAMQRAGGRGNTK